MRPDKSFTPHWACLAQEINGAFQRFRDKGEPNTHPGDRYIDRPDFLSFATQYGLSRYVGIKLEGSHNVSLADRPGKPLLHYCFEPGVVPEHQLRPRMIQVLCDRGAHPLDGYRGSTAWDKLLRYPATSPQLAQNWREVAEIFIQATDRTGQTSHLRALLLGHKKPA